MGQVQSDRSILWLQLAGLKWRVGPIRRMDAEPVIGGLSKIPSLAGFMPGERKIEEIWGETSLESDCFFKNQAGRIYGYSGCNRYIGIQN